MANAQFYPVYPKFWAKAKRMAWSDQVVRLGLYLITCKHRNLEGLYHLPLAYVEADNGWSRRTVKESLDQLLRDGFVEYDDEAEVVLLRNALEYYQPKSPRQIAGALTALETLPVTPLLRGLLDSADTHAEGFAEALRGAFSLNGRNGVGDPVG